MWYVAGIPIVERNHATVVNILFWGPLAVVFIVLRIYTRAFITKRLGWDDWLMLAAMASSIVTLVGIMYRESTHSVMPLHREQNKF
jgi:hypothetical protein